MDEIGGDDTFNSYEDTIAQQHENGQMHHESLIKIWSVLKVRIIIQYSITFSIIVSDWSIKDQLPGNHELNSKKTMQDILTKISTRYLEKLMSSVQYVMSKTFGKCNILKLQTSIALAKKELPKSVECQTGWKVVTRLWYETNDLSF